MIAARLAEKRRNFCISEWWWWGTIKFYSYCGIVCQERRPHKAHNEPGGGTEEWVVRKIIKMRQRRRHWSGRFHSEHNQFVVISERKFDFPSPPTNNGIVLIVHPVSQSVILLLNSWGYFYLLGPCKMGHADNRTREGLITDKYLRKWWLGWGGCLCTECREGWQMWWAR